MEPRHSQASGEQDQTPKEHRPVPEMVEDAASPLPRGAERPVRDQLTSREKEIVDLIADGYSNKAIAVHLFLAEGTVKGHVSSIIRKLGLKNRTEVAMKAARDVRVNGSHWLVLGEAHGAIERIGTFVAEDAEQALDQGKNAEPEWESYIAVPQDACTIRDRSEVAAE
jgi:DNA-binding CsgD family transcriptional regulator